MFLQETGSCCNSDVNCPICPKFIMLDKSPSLKTCTSQYWLIVKVPPTGNRKQALCTLSTLLKPWFEVDVLQRNYENDNFYAGKCCYCKPLACLYDCCRCCWFHEVGFFFVLFFFVLQNQCHKLLEGLVSLRFIQLFYKYILLETLQLGDWPDFHTAWAYCHYLEARWNTLTCVARLSTPTCVCLGWL